MKACLVSTILTITLLLGLDAFALDHPGITVPFLQEENFILIENGVPLSIIYDESDYEGVKIAVRNLRQDFGRVCGTMPSFGGGGGFGRGGSGRAVIAGSINSKVIQDLVTSGKLDVSPIAGKRETYIMTTVESPSRFVSEALVIAGSDKRGTIYGIYELSEQMGVSPWYYWADVPVVHHEIERASCRERVSPRV